MTILKNPQGEQASVMISFRGKMPKQIIITGDNGFVEIEDFPRAEKAVFHFNDGTTSIIDLGRGEEVFTYELDTLNAYINEENQNNDLRETTMHVINLMDQMRDSWNRK
ncbi:MAG: gfo/Idh/MocA family oxidoreductase, partial [Vagococcus sp.]